MAMDLSSQEIMHKDNIVKESKTTSKVVEYENGGFDCNICLESVQDPVVTLCGHLYCYPCIYKWIDQQNTSLDIIPNKNNPQQCPVCKRDISQQTLIPLYGRGQTTKPQSEKKCPDRMVVPRRPRGLSCETTTVSTEQTRGFIAVPDVINPTSPTMGMLEEMVYGSLLGNTQASLYAYPNSYNLAAVSSQRARRRAMQADRSLGRICFFLFCCMLMCLILF